jgi:large subunit ribosomal protein L6
VKSTKLTFSNFQLVTYIYLMSRIGKLPIKLLSGVTYTLTQDEVVIKGPKGTLSWKMLPGVSIKEEEGSLLISIEDPTNAQQKAYWGLTRACIANMVT